MSSNFLKYGVIFAAGVAIGALVNKNNEEIRGACTKAVDGMLNFKDRAVETVEVLKESAQDLIAESCSKSKPDAK